MQKKKFYLLVLAAIFMGSFLIVFSFLYVWHTWRSSRSDQIKPVTNDFVEQMTEILTSGIIESDNSSGDKIRRNDKRGTLLNKSLVMRSEGKDIGRLHIRVRSLKKRGDHASTGTSLASFNASYVFEINFQEKNGRKRLFKTNLIVSIPPHAVYITNIVEEKLARDKKSYPLTIKVSPSRLLDVLSQAEGAFNIDSKEPTASSKAPPVEEKLTEEREAYLSFLSKKPKSTTRSKVYWINSTPPLIQRADLNGDNIEVVVKGDLVYPVDIDIDQKRKRFIWTDFMARKITTATLTGRDRKTLKISKLGGPLSIALNPENHIFYFSDFSRADLVRTRLDGAFIDSLFVKGDTFAKGLCVDPVDKRIYWTDFEEGKIWSVKTDGKDQMAVVTNNISKPWALALDPVERKLYWTDTGYSIICRANLDGSKQETIISEGVDIPLGLTLDVKAKKLYWSDFRLHNIQRANLDGSNIETVVSEVISGPRGIALYLKE